MAGFGDALAAERQAKRQHRDVEVTLDSEVADRLAAIEAKIDEIDDELDGLVVEEDEIQADLRLSDPRTKDIDERRKALLARQEELDTERGTVAEGTLWTFRFLEIPGQAWAEICVRNPPRLDVSIDRRYGYNYHEAVKQAATFRDADGTVYGGPLQDDGTIEALTLEQWADVWLVLSGHEFERIASAVWDLNEYGPQQKLVSAGKASRAGSSNKSSSPST